MHTITMGKPDSRIIMARSAAFYNDYVLLPDFIFYCNLHGGFANFREGKGFQGKIMIFQAPKFLPLHIEPFMEGPFFSEDHVKEASVVHAIFNCRDFTKAANLLCKKIRSTNQTVFENYFVTEFQKFLPALLEHTFIGSHHLKTFTGLHFYTSELNFENRFSRKGTKGVFSARPLIVANNGIDILRKKKESTFWPQNWSIPRFAIECAFAWNNKTQQTPDMFYGRCRSGIDVVFCFDQGDFKTAFPLGIM